MNFKSLILNTVLAVALISFVDAEVAPPSAQQILEGARMSATLTKLNAGLSGRLQKKGINVPVTLFLNGKDIQFQFSENKEPLRIFHMRMGDEAFNLLEISNGKTQAFPPDKIVQPIAGTDMTYEDLALRFFYWPNPKLDGVEDVAGEPCYKIRVDKPRGSAGRYEVVYVWVHTKYGAFMQIRGHNKTGGLVKEFKVQSIMKVSKDVYTLEKMQVATCDPNKNGDRVSLTDLTFEKPKAAGPRGIR